MKRRKSEVLFKELSEKERNEWVKEKEKMNFIQMKASTSFVSMDVVTFYGILLHAYQHARKNED